ncbi:hypothetical protein A5742_08605 [Mycolicibacterium fortuitum]|uniref:Uncharacterized protein n=1 Tax=Mycolicibacterium fortuitum TaxID=1766 RepID=A0ABD6QG38_MYCFO|nr:hypothetical protein A5742_08605 [Mycolicibacterium fortuitum]
MGADFVCDGCAELTPDDDGEESRSASHKISATIRTTMIVYDSVSPMIARLRPGWPVRLI